MRLFGWLEGLSLMAVALVALISFPFLGIGLYEAYQNWQKINAYTQTSGTVVGNSYATTNDGGNISGAYYPVVEFKPEGTAETVRFTDGIGSLPPDYEPGAKVRVIYRPDNPKEARLYSWKRIWLVPSLLIFIGLLPIIVAVILMRVLGGPSRPVAAKSRD